MSSHLPIGLFDSGIGGLSVVRAVRRLLAAEDLLYIADSASGGYGDKPPEDVRGRALAIGEFLQHQGCKAVVVACNTATAMAVELLRERLAIPVIGMEPALKPAAKRTDSGVVAVLATAGTLASGRYAALRDRHGRRARVIERVCPHWVALVERGELAGGEARAAVAAELDVVRAAGADVLVLGCTHFPFLAPLLRELAGPGVAVVDPSPAVAAQLRRQLEQRDALAVHQRGRLRLLSTEPDRVHRQAAAIMTGFDLPWERLAL